MFPGFFNSWISVKYFKFSILVSPVSVQFVIMINMSETQVFVIRLFINSHIPHTLRGSIESVSVGYSRMFTDGQSLLDALNHMLNLSDDMPVDEMGNTSPQNNRSREKFGADSFQDKEKTHE